MGIWQDIKNNFTGHAEWQQKISKAVYGEEAIARFNNVMPTLKEKGASAAFDELAAGHKTGLTHAYEKMVGPEALAGMANTEAALKRGDIKGYVQGVYENDMSAVRNMKGLVTGATEATLPTGSKPASAPLPQGAEEGRGPK